MKTILHRFLPSFPSSKKVILRGVICFALIPFAGSIAQGQLVVDNAVNAVDGVQNILLGPGIEVSNITFAGSDIQVAGFTCPNCNVGLESGLILAAGNASLATGPNNSGSTSSTGSGFGASDPDLALAMGGSLNDAAVLQFDFVPTGDSLVFRYVFGSEEYSEFLGFGDIFGFFLSGPGISGPYTNNAANLAIVPGTTLPVSVPNVNNGSTGTNGPCVNCAYFIHNGNGTQAPYNGSNYYIQQDGFTTVLTAFALVECGETYHIKLAIADAGDTSWDSVVYLEAGSFQSNQVDVAFELPDFAPSDTSVYEGCDEAYITFTRPGNTDEEASFDISVGGTATNGVDYFLIGQTLTFEAGENTVSLPILAYQDGITEGTETITITVESGIACLANSSFELTIVEAEPLQATIADVIMDCGEIVTLEPEISGGVGVYGIDWSNGESGTSLDVSPVETTTYFYTITDTCQVESISGSVTVSIPDYAPLLVNIGPDLELNCVSVVNLNATVSGGHGPYTYEWVFAGSVISETQNVNFQPDDPGTLILSVTDQCGTVTTDQLQITFPPIVITVDLGGDEDANCLSNLFITSDVYGGAGNLTYTWTVNGEFFGNGLAIIYPVTGPAVVVLTVTDECGNESSDEMLVSLDPSGLNVSLGPDQTINCLQSVNLNPNVDGGDGNLVYQWTVNGQNAGSGTTLSLDPDVTTTVVLTVTDQCGWSDSDQMVINVPAVPVNLTLTPDQVLCPGDGTTLVANASGGVGTLSYEWNPGGNTSTSINITPGNSTTYTLSVEDQCGNSANGEVEVTVLQYSPFAVAENFTICINVSRPGLAEGGQPPYIFTYSGQEIQIQNGVLSGIKPGSVNVLVEDQCGNSGTFDVLVSSCATTIPNIFTPNDDGDNQNFFIDGLSGYPGSSLRVFNRWGALVFESDNYKNNWDGGEVPDGVYFYTFDRVDGEQANGYVTILRSK